MRVVVIGASGTIGKEIVRALTPEHEIVKVGHKSGDFHVDLVSKESIARLFEDVGSFDAVICAAGAARFGSLDDLTDEDFMLALTNKLMGQVNVVRVGRHVINDNGSFTLTSGVLSREPMPGSSSISMANGGLEAFVRAAALELERGVRINIVSPVFVKETMEAMRMDSSGGMPAEKVPPAYKESLEGKRTGEALDVREFA